jgi:hypothetical protein
MEKGETVTSRTGSSPSNGKPYLNHRPLEGNTAANNLYLSVITKG